MYRNRLAGVMPPKERYQRPHTYSFLVGTVPICASIANQRIPVLSVIFQADIANTDTISIGDSQVSATNGMQLDPGRAIQFSILDVPLSGTLMPGISNIERFQLPSGNQREFDLYIDIRDFFAIADAAAQRLRVFWSTISR